MGLPWAALWVGLLIVGTLGSTAVADQTAASWVIVVNADDFQSRSIANHYIALRDIPPQNVISLSGIPADAACSHEDFTDRILRPVLQTIATRQLQRHIQGIAYSAGFPQQVSFPAVDAGKVPGQVLTPVVSLTSATYLYQYVLDPKRSPVGLGNNHYARLPVSSTFNLSINYTRKNAAAERSENTEQDGEKPELTAQERIALMREYLRQFPEQSNLWYVLAAELLAADRKEEALSALETAVARGFAYGQLLRDDRRFLPLAGEERFRQALSASGTAPTDFTEPRTFDAQAVYAPNGAVIKKAAGGSRYLLSVSLAAFGTFGNTLDEAITCLERAAAADGTRPDAAVYFQLTDDVRTTTRQPLMEMAVKKLAARGIRAEIDRRVLPIIRDDCIGVMLGAANFQWRESRSTLLPGAIVDNLTSYGGWLHQDSQTTLAEPLRHGAAGSSGTVIEPFALQTKFPTPLLYESYCRGATLAEAFYENVHSPFQLWIVGDPLCCPYDRPQPLKLRFEAEGGPRLLLDDAPDSDAVTPTSKDESLPEGDIQWLIDSVVRSTSPGDDRSLPLDGLRLSDGWHAATAIVQWSDGRRDEARTEFVVGQPAYTFRAERDGGTQLTLSIDPPAANELSIVYLDQVVGTIAPGQSRVSVSAMPLDLGPHRYQLVAADDLQRRGLAPPLTVLSR